MKGGSAINLFQAHRQWASRPPDERFWTLQELCEFCQDHRTRAEERKLPWRALRVVAVSDKIEGGLDSHDEQGSLLADTPLHDHEEVALVPPSETPALMTHWSFEQLCGWTGAPSQYLRSLPADKAADLLSYHLSRLSLERPAHVLRLRANGNCRLLAITSDRYTRIWNSDIAQRLLNFSSEGWRVPPARPAYKGQSSARPATPDDLLKMRGFELSVREGDFIAPAGLYASDRDMFAFLVHEGRRINDGTSEGLGRGFFVWNSEVGAVSFGVMFFLYRYMCGNHIVWGAEEVRKRRIIHTVKADEKAFQALTEELRRYANTRASIDEARIRRAKRKRLGITKEKVVLRILSRRINALTRAALEAAYDVAEQYEHIDGPPQYVWGMAQGLTRLAQQTPYTNQRVAMDQAVGRVLEMAS